MIYADYTFYLDDFFGIQITDENEYMRCAVRAAADIDYYTMGRAKDNAESDAVKLASCAVAEIYQIIGKSQSAAASEKGELASESVGSYSRSYRSSAETANNARMQIKAAIEHYLAPTGLLYRGASVCIHHI